MDYTWTVSTPTSFSGKLLMSMAAVRHRFLAAVFVVCCCFFVLVGVEFIVDESHSWKKVQCSRFFKPSFSCFICWFCLWTSKRKDGWMVVSSLTLHSGQSYPGTQGQPGSRTGTHPGRETEDTNRNK